MHNLWGFYVIFLQRLATICITVGEKLSSRPGCLVVVFLHNLRLNQSHNKSSGARFFYQVGGTLALHYGIIRFPWSLGNFRLKSTLLMQRHFDDSLSLSRVLPLSEHSRGFLSFSIGFTAFRENFLWGLKTNHWWYHTLRQVVTSVLQLCSRPATTQQRAEKRQLPIWQCYNQHQSQ